MLYHMQLLHRKNMFWMIRLPKIIAVPYESIYGMLHTSTNNKWAATWENTTTWENPTMWLCVMRRLRSAGPSAKSDQSVPCADPEGGGGGGGGVRTPPWKSLKIWVFFSNTGPDPLKIAKLPSQHSILGHNWLATETPFKWRFAGRLMMAR